MNKISLKIMALIISLAFTSCNKEPAFEDHMLDADLVFDPSLNDPQAYLVSARYPNPTPADLKKHIIIAAHGYTATTFEWSEFREWSTDTNYRISQVLLGAHGRSYADFKASTWEDWGESLQREYEALTDLGYKKISFVGSSTGGTLLLEMIKSQYFNQDPIPENIFLIDPIVVPSAKLQSVAGILGPMLVFVESDQTEEEDRYWYRFRPQETIQELNELINKVRHDLEDGFQLPAGCYLKVFHSSNDPTANSLSTVLIYKGLSHADGAPIEVQIMDSDIHVFTRLKLRDEVSSLDRNNQIDAFQQIAQRLNP